MPLDPAEEDYQKAERFKRKGLFLALAGAGLGGGRSAAPLSSSFALKTKKVTVTTVNGRTSKAASPGSVQRKSLVARPPATGEGLPYPGSWDPTPHGCGARGVRLRKAWSARVLVAKETRWAHTQEASPCLGAQIRRGSWSLWSSTTSRDTAAH